MVTSDLAAQVTFSERSQSLVTAPGVTITGSGVNTNDVVSSGSQGFLWVEATIDFGDQAGINLGTFSPFSTIENSVITNVNNTTANGNGVKVGTSSHSLTVSGVTMSDVSRGLRIDIADCALLEDVDITGNGPLELPAPPGSRCRAWII